MKKLILPPEDTRKAYRGRSMTGGELDKQNVELTERKGGAVCVKELV